MQPRFGLSILGGVTAKEEKLMVFSHNIGVKGFIAHQHSTEVLKLHWACSLIVCIIIDAEVVATKVNADSCFGNRVDCRKIRHHLWAKHQIASCHIFSSLFY